MSSTFLIVGLLVPAVLILGLIEFRLRARDPSLQYRQAKPLDDARQILYWRLVEAFPGSVVLPHVAFGRFLQVTAGSGAGTGDRPVGGTGIDHLHADFLVCRRDFSVVAAIMLDDGPRSRAADPQHRHMLDSAGVSVHRVPADGIPPAMRLREMLSLPATAAAQP